MLRRIATVAGSVVEFGSGYAYVGRIKRGVAAVNLEDGSARHLTDARFPALLAVSPDGGRLALYDSGRALRVVDLGGGGAERSLPIRYGCALEWLDPDRLLFRNGGDGRVYDSEMRLVRKYPFFRANGQAHVGQRLYGTDRYRLRSLHVGSG